MRRHGIPRCTGRGTSAYAGNEESPSPIGPGALQAPGHPRAAAAALLRCWWRGPGPAALVIGTAAVTTVLPEIPPETLAKWQRAVDLTARLARVPASLIMRTEGTDAPICQDTPSGGLDDLLTSAEVGHDALVNLSREEAFQAADDVAFGPARGDASGDVVAGRLVELHPDDDGSIEGRVGVSVAASIEAVPTGGHPRRGRDRAGAAELREGGLRTNPVGVIAEDDQQLSCLSLQRRPCFILRRAEPRRCHRRLAGAVRHTERTRGCATSAVATSPRGSGGAPSRVHQDVPAVNARPHAGDMGTTLGLILSRRQRLARRFSPRRPSSTIRIFSLAASRRRGVPQMS